MKIIHALLACAALLPAPLLAQSRPAPSTTHVEEDAEIIVTGNFVRELDILPGSSVLSGADLVRDMRPQLGDTLTRLPGVSATSFSPGASRPVLRGFQGERVKVLTDGIGAIDVSSTSADHAVTIDPLTAERIEVLHGPAVLLFGSQAIGGAVNVLDRRIPRAVPDEGYHIDGIGAYGSAADERSIGGAIDVAASDSLVVHFDASYRNTDDLEIGGFVLSPELRAEQEETAAEELAEGHVEEAEEAAELAAQRRRLPNSATESKTAGIGLALIRDGGSIGASFSWLDSDYGVPARPGAGHHHHEEGEGEEHKHEHEHEGDEDEHGEHEHGEEAVTIGLRQYRGDLRGELNLRGDFVDKLRLRVGIADYSHTEYEGDEVGTIFRTKGVEGRFELVQATRGDWRGVTGLQHFSRDFEAVGAEAFVPANNTNQTGIFTLQEFGIGRVGLEAAARFEHGEVRSRAAGIDRDFNSFSAAIGASYEVAERVKIGFNASRAERAPSAEELLSDGPHIATQAYEIGDPTLRSEKSLGAEAYLRAEGPGYRFSLSLYANDFDDYIFDAATGEEEDGLPVFRYFQSDARYRGFEAEGSATIAETGGVKIVADGVADYVRATLSDGGGPVPRIPPLRLLGGLEAQSEAVDGRVEVEWADDQDRVAALEGRTDGHTLVNASVAWRPWGRERETAITLSANNIFDVDARRHASFTKGFVPLAGRDIRVSARFSF